MPNHKTFWRSGHAAVIVLAALFGAAVNSIFDPAWPAIAAAGVVALIQVVLLARSEQT